LGLTWPRDRREASRHGFCVEPITERHVSGTKRAWIASRFNDTSLYNQTLVLLLLPEKKPTESTLQFSSLDSLLQWLLPLLPLLPLHQQPPLPSSRALDLPPTQKVLIFIPFLYSPVLTNDQHLIWIYRFLSRPRVSLINAFVFLFSAPQIASFRFLERPNLSSVVVNLTQRGSSARPLNAQPQRNHSIVPLAATIVAPGTFSAFCCHHISFFSGDFLCCGFFLALIGGDLNVLFLFLFLCFGLWCAEVEKGEEDFEQLAKDLENASPLEIMDKALEKFGNDIAIAFR